MEAEGAPLAAAAPIPVEQVFQILSSALSYDNATRAVAEEQLRAWESDAAPGFIGSLLKVVAEVQAVPEVGAAGPHGARCRRRCPAKASSCARQPCRRHRSAAAAASLDRPPCLPIPTLPAYRKAASWPLWWPRTRWAAAGARPLAAASGRACRVRPEAWAGRGACAHAWRGGACVQRCLCSLDTRAAAVQCSSVPPVALRRTSRPHTCLAPSPQTTRSNTFAPPPWGCCWATPRTVWPCRWAGGQAGAGGGWHAWLLRLCGCGSRSDCSTARPHRLPAYPRRPPCSSPILRASTCPRCACCCHLCDLAVCCAALCPPAGAVKQPAAKQPAVPSPAPHPAALGSAAA